MRLELVRIGNSRGIRIPKPLIEECGLGETVELNIERGRLVITPAHSPRQGWREAFAAAEGTNDQPLMPMLPNDFDAEEWTW